MAPISIEDSRRIDHPIPTGEGSEKKYRCRALLDFAVEMSRIETS